MIRWWRAAEVDPAPNEVLFSVVPPAVRSFAMFKRRLLLAAVLAAAVACASGAGAVASGAGPRSDSMTISADELSQATQLNLYDYIAAYRPRWLQSRSPSNMQGRALNIVVYVDNSLLGGTTLLKGVTLSGVTMIRFYDASEAQQRFSAHDAGGVIQVITTK
jgi:hypothetical protein